MEAEEEKKSKNEMASIFLYRVTCVFYMPRAFPLSVFSLPVPHIVSLELCSKGFEPKTAYKPKLLECLYPCYLYYIQA